MKVYFYYKTDMYNLSEINAEKLLNLINHDHALSQEEILQDGDDEKFLEVEIIPIAIYEVKKQTSLVKLDDK